MDPYNLLLTWLVGVAPPLCIIPVIYCALRARHEARRLTSLP